jgi:redox-sensitive bicupin YhaK (pirin superfamily)
MLDLVIGGSRKDLGGGLQVGRVLPFACRWMVGPFIFLDHMGPADFRSGEGTDVRPHPHIGLATVTYLFDGEIHHRDSLGVSHKIRPGEVDWMTAGSGIVQSERTDPHCDRAAG